MKFEVGKTYISRRGDKITISKRTERTVWFLQSNFSARIKVNENNVEYISPDIGMVRSTYYADKVS